mmetsp:Transcript_5355/g.20004  ORF Transcript_5355/g.20004 Transcript_5355/m.20004 type:complete len:427 (-) Transcript_5355:94-1374(-)
MTTTLQPAATSPATLPLEKKINDEYKIWKKNTSFLYDLVLTHALEWPSLTVQWLPTVQKKDNFQKQKIILGTHTSNQEQNYLMIAELTLPQPHTEIDIRKYDSSNMQQGGFGVTAVDVIQTINHDGEINNAKYMPQNPNVIATKTIAGPVYIFDVTKHPTTPNNQDTACRPNLKLMGNQKEGYGLSWSTLVQGRIASAGGDGLINVWEIESEQGKSELQPSISIPVEFKDSSQFGRGVESVCFHHHHRDILGAACDDRMLRVYDLRSPTMPAREAQGHDSEINDFNFSPFNEFLFATAGADSLVKLWDLRNLKKSLHTLQGHADEVFHAQFSPHNDSVLATAGADRRVMVWDITRVGQSQSVEDSEDGPPELLFIHGGHTSKVSDIAWNPAEDWMMASVAEDNILQVWQVAQSIYYANDEEDEMQE